MIRQSRDNETAMVIPDDILETARVSEAELRSDLALVLFARERLTLAQAARVAEMPQLEFQSLLAARRIPIHYDVAEFEQDVKTLERLASR
jgi:predicted HTH domain antitoxin